MVKVVQEFIDADSDSDTILISVSDHETGGVAVGRQVTPEYPEYRWDPFVLENVKKSSFYLARQIRSFGCAMKKVKDVMKREMGITDATERELTDVCTGSSVKEVAGILADMVSFRAEIGFSTHGHSAVDVNIYMYGKMGEKTLKGNVENTDISKHIVEYLGIEKEMKEINT
jgi:alkaline phosphatase